METRPPGRQKSTRYRMVVHTEAGQSKCSVAVLAGGQSRRMGQPKALMPWGSQSILSHMCSRVSRWFWPRIIVADPDFAIGVVDFLVVADELPGLGPLAALGTALHHCQDRPVWLLACDMPLVEPSVGLRLAALADGHDGAVPVVGGRPQYLQGCYGPTVASTLAACLERGQRSLEGLCREADVVWVDAADLNVPLRSFVNLNTPSEYHKWVPPGTFRRGEPSAREGG